jgi:hypothetical protein
MSNTDAAFVAGALALSLASAHVVVRVTHNIIVAAWGGAEHTPRPARRDPDCGGAAANGGAPHDDPTTALSAGSLLTPIGGQSGSSSCGRSGACCGDKPRLVRAGGGRPWPWGTKARGGGDRL